MKSMVVSASEFMTDKTKLIDASCIGPAARHRSKISAMPAIDLWPIARLLGVISSETLNCARARRLSGADITQCIQFDQTKKSCFRSEAFRGRFSKAAEAISAFNS